MRSAGASLIAFMDNASRTVIRHLVTLTLRDSTVHRWTDHDQPLVVSGNTFYPGGTSTYPIVRVGRVTEVPGAEIGECEIELLCGESASIGGVHIPLACINGTLDGSEVKVELVFGDPTPDVSMGALWLFEGVVAEAEPTSTTVTLSVVDGREELNILLPRTHIAPQCQAMLFDSQCGLNKSTFTHTGHVHAGATTTAIPTNATQATHYFRDGIITFDGNITASLAGLKRAVRAYSNTAGTFTLDEPLPSAPAENDTWSAFAGCDKRMETCDSTFNNLESGFRGFPYVKPSFEPGSVGTFTYNQELGRMVWGVAWSIIPGKGSVDTDRVLPIVYGRRKVRARQVWAAPPNTPNLYSNQYDSIFAVCEGEVGSALRLWTDGEYRGPATGSFYEVDSIFKAGTRPTQTVPTYLSTNYADEALAYPGVAYYMLRRQVDATSSECEIEVNGLEAGTGDATTGDANPADVIQDLLTDTDYGAGFLWDVVTDSGPDAGAATASSYRRYVTQAKLWLSPLLDSRRPALEWLDEILESTNATCRFTSAGLQIVSLGDQDIGTYDAYVTAQYALNEDDYLSSSSDDPIRVQRKALEATSNVIPVAFVERTPDSADAATSGGYEEREVEDLDPLDVSENGLRRASAVVLPMICLDEVAVAISRIKSQTSIRSRNRYTFRLPWTYRRLEVCDYLSLSDARFGLSSKVVRITRLDWDGESLTVEAEDAPYGMTTAMTRVTQRSESSSTLRTMSLQSQLHQTAVRNWTASSIGTGAWASICWGDGLWVAAGNQVISTSADGVTWTAAGTVPATNYACVAYNGTQYVSMGLNGGAYSSDADTWVSASTAPAGSYRSVTWDPSAECWVAVGTKFFKSYDGDTWTEEATPSANLYAVATDGVGTLVAVGAGVAYTSTSGGDSWTSRTIPTGTWLSVTYGRGLFCAAGSGALGAPKIATSPDGITWTSRSPPSPASSRPLYSVIYTGALFVAVDITATERSAAIFTSPDGIAWTATAPGLPNDDGYKALAWNGSRAAAVTTDVCAISGGT